MDTFKTAILEILQKDCRMPLEKIAASLDTTVEAVAQAIDEMEQEKVILRYAAVVNWDKTEKNNVEGVIEVKCIPQRATGFDMLARSIYNFDEVKSVYLMSGSYDLLVRAEAPTLKQLALFVSEKLSALETVTGTATSFVLKRFKKDGIIYEEEDDENGVVFSD